MLNCNLPKLLFPVMAAVFVVLPSGAAITAGFRIEQNQLFLPGDPAQNLNRDNYSSDGLNVRVYAGSTTTTDLSNIFSLAAAFNAGSQDPLSAFNNLVSAPQFTGWLPVDVSTGLGPQTSFDWISPTISLPAGSENGFAFLLVTSQPLDLISASSFVGIVYNSTTSPNPDATVNYGFTSGATFDSALVGQLSSLTLTPIPEPRVYAAIFGLAALGFVAWRRRVRR